jgi:hypothetical protein
MVQRVKLLNRGGDDGSAVHVSFSRTNGLLTVRDSAKEIGEAEESCEWSAPEDFGFKVDADYLVQVLSRTRKANIVDIVRGKKHVVLFKDDNFDHVLALMR